MKRSVGIWQLFGFAVTSLGGTVLHFLYDWLGEAVWVAPFSGVNESTWEHMKLLFFRGYGEFWGVKLRGITLGIALIPLIFYTYNGVIGKSPDWINIAIFFVSAAASFIYETRLLNSGKVACRRSGLAVTVLVIIAVLFVIFTFLTPPLGIFRDPLTGGYGIAATVRAVSV